MHKFVNAWNKCPHAIIAKLGIFSRISIPIRKLVPVRRELLTSRLFWQRLRTSELTTYIFGKLFKSLWMLNCSVNLKLRHGIGLNLLWSWCNRFTSTQSLRESWSTFGYLLQVLTLLRILCLVLGTLLYSCPYAVDIKIVSLPSVEKFTRSPPLRTNLQSKLNRNSSK